MVDEVVPAKPTAHLEPKQRYSFSLRLLMVVMTIVAAGAALAASYPFIAGLLAFAFILELVPLGLQAAAIQLGQGKYRRLTIGISLCFVLGCIIWTLMRGTGPAILGILLGSFFLFMAWLSSIDSKKMK